MTDANPEDAGLRGWMARSWGSTLIGGKLLLPFTIVMGAISIFVCLYFPAALEKREEEALLEKGRSVAAMAAFNVQPGLVFSDRKEIEASLEGVFETPDVVLAQVFGADGMPLVELSRPNIRVDGAGGLASLQTSGTVQLLSPVLLRADTVGEVAIHLSRAELVKSVARTRGGIGFLAIFIFFAGVAALATLSHIVTRPLAGIVRSAREVTGGNLASRAPVTTNDEIGILAKAFNEMVTQLESSQEKLQLTNRDLEERVAERTAALLESEAKLRQIHKMEAVGRLAGGVAHDFNNLLTVITGHVELLLVGRDAGDPDFEELEEVKRAADRAADLTRQLLAFGRRQVLRPQTLDPNEVVQEASGMLSRVMGEHIRVETRCDPSVGEINADPGQLERALLNLALNAKDAMPKGGLLTLETSRMDHTQAKETWGYSLPPGLYAMLTFRDTGSGIPRADLTKVFEPFFSTKDFGDGSGLGLAMVYGIVKQSGGFVYVDSQVGEWTEFRLFFPGEGTAAADVEGEPEMDADEARSSELALIPGNETILVVEDEDMVRNLACSILQRAGYTVLSASGSLEAIGVLKNHPSEIHLLLTDVIMPGITGDELVERAKPLRPEMAMLFMSGHSGKALDGVASSGIGLVEKPFKANQLAQAVRSALDGDASTAAA